MRHKYIWGLCTGEVKKPIQVENDSNSKSSSTASSRVWERLYPRESSGEAGERAGKVNLQDGSPRHPLLPYQSDAASFPEGEA